MCSHDEEFTLGLGSWQIISLYVHIWELFWTSPSYYTILLFSSVLSTSVSKVKNKLLMSISKPNRWDVLPLLKTRGDLGNWAPEQLGNGPHGEIVLSTTWPQINFINSTFKPRGAQCAKKTELGTSTIPWQLGKFILWGRLYEMIKSSRTATKGTLCWNC